MSVSRKNKKSNKMKRSSKSSKSSKRSKNVRNSKKSRKHMKKMRGGGYLDLGVNQTVDFIIYHGNEILLTKNKVVTGKDTDYTLIGTFANSSKETNPQLIRIDEGIANYNNPLNKNKNGWLIPVNKTTAMILLKKKLKDKIDPDIISQLNSQNIVPLNEFEDIKDDERLKEKPCNEVPCPCSCKTQPIIVYLPTRADIIVKNEFEWVKYPFEDDKPIFSSHREIIDKLEPQLFKKKLVLEENLSGENNINV